MMKPYIPKQEKRVRERIEAKLDAEVVRELERYCQYLDSDRDYVLAQALEIAFRKDRGFNQWISAQPDEAAPAVPAEMPGVLPTQTRLRHRKIKPEGKDRAAEPNEFPEPT